jgi:hypothetical protein
VLLHASLIPLIDGFPEEMPLRAIEDYALWLRVATYTPFAYIEEPLVVYADDTQDSIRYQSPATNLDRNKVLYENFRKWLLQKNRSSYHFIKYTVSYAAIKNFYQKVVPITHRIRRIYAK